MLIHFFMDNFVNPDALQAINKMKSLVWPIVWSERFFQALQETFIWSVLHNHHFKMLYTEVNTVNILSFFFYV